LLLLFDGKLKLQRVFIGLYKERGNVKVYSRGQEGVYRKPFFCKDDISR
jgi:hypothetical protein